MDFFFSTLFKNKNFKNYQSNVKFLSTHFVKKISFKVFSLYLCKISEKWFSFINGFDLPSVKVRSHNASSSCSRHWRRQRRFPATTCACVSSSRCQNVIDDGRFGRWRRRRDRSFSELSRRFDQRLRVTRNRGSRTAS